MVNKNLRKPFSALFFIIFFTFFLSSHCNAQDSDQKQTTTNNTLNKDPKASTSQVKKYTEITNDLKDPEAENANTTQTSITDTADSSTASDDANNQADTTTIKDPYEGFNRAAFNFNDKLDTYFLKPVATFYNKVVPRPLNQGIHNFFNNIDTVPTIANDLLQFHFYQMANDLWRLGINTTIGIGGLFDIASRINLRYYSNDFGLTMAYWGYDNSNYIVLPFWGPNTIRDGIGLPVDYFVFSIYPYIHPDSRRYELYAWWVVDHRAHLLQFEPVYEEAAYDKYIFVRTAYMQKRNYEIEQNKHLGYKDQQNGEKTTFKLHRGA